MHRIRAVCFDLDNTLWDVWPVIVRAEQETYAFLAERYPRLVAKYSIEALRMERERLAKDEPHMGHDFSYLRKAALRRCAASVGYDASLADEAFEVFYRVRNEVTLYSDVLPALERLQVRFKLYSLTNGNADLTRIGLRDYFHDSYSAVHVGQLKPAPAMFLRVLSHSGLPPEAVLHIGDDPIADVHGARQIGMQTVWLNRTGERWPAAHGPEPQMAGSMDDILTMLGVSESR